MGCARVAGSGAGYSKERQLATVDQGWGHLGVGAGEAQSSQARSLGCQTHVQGRVLSIQARAGGQLLDNGQAFHLWRRHKSLISVTVVHLIMDSMEVHSDALYWRYLWPCTSFL